MSVNVTNYWGDADKVRLSSVSQQANENVDGPAEEALPGQR